MHPEWPAGIVVILVVVVVAVVVVVVVVVVVIVVVVARAHSPCEVHRCLSPSHERHGCDPNAAD